MFANTHFEHLPAGSLARERPEEVMAYMSEIRHDFSYHYKRYHTVLLADVLIDGKPAIITCGNQKLRPDHECERKEDTGRICSENWLCLIIEQLRAAGHRVVVIHIFLLAPYRPEKDRLATIDQHVRIRTPCGICLGKIEATPEIDPDMVYFTIFTLPGEDGKPEAILTVKTRHLLDAWNRHGRFGH